MRTCERCSCHSDDFCTKPQFYTPIGKWNIPFFPCHSEGTQWPWESSRKAHPPSKHSRGIAVWAFVPLILRVKRACAVSNCENKCGHWQSPQNFRFYLGDCHVATVVAPRNDIVWAVATTAMPFEQLSLRAQAWQSPGRETKQLPTQQKQTKQKK